MANKTYTYIGAAGSAIVANSPLDWSPSPPSGNTGPGPGATVIFNAGTVLFSDQTFQSNTVFLAGGTLDFYGDGNVNPSTAPTLDNGSVISTDAALAEKVSGAPLTATIGVFGNFINEGSILAAGPPGSTLTIAVAGTSIGATYYPGLLTNFGEIGVAAGNTLTIALTGTSGLLAAGGAIQANGGYLDIAGPAGGYVATSGGVSAALNVGGGGTVETNVAFNSGASGVAFLAFTDSSAGNTFKIDNLGSFTGQIQNFGFNDTIDLGSSLAVGTLIFNQNTGTLDLVQPGSVVAALNLGSGNFTGGTFALAGVIGTGTTATADGFGLTLGADGNTQVIKNRTTYTYIGAAGTANNGNSKTGLWSPAGSPNAGDSVIFNAGTLDLFGPNLKTNTIYVTGGTLAFYGDANTVVQNNNNNNQSNGRSGPTMDQASAIVTNAAVVETVAGTPQTATIDTFGNFIGQGSIIANGPVGSAMTIAIAGTTLNGTYFPGTFVNYGKIEAEAGNTLVIAIGATAELLNASLIAAAGGTVDIQAAANAAGGGYAGVAGVALITAGGTLETNATYGTTVAGVPPLYIFGDATAGNTVKIDTIGSFGGQFLGFGVGDTIDLGASIAVSSLVYTAASGLLYLENNGSVVDTLLFTGGNYSGGVLTGTAGHGSTATAGTFGLTLGADGNTQLVSSAHTDVFKNLSGAWQTGAAWNTGTPGTQDTVFIGLGATAPFTLTTGTAPVSVGDMLTVGHQGLIQITSATTVTSNGIQTAGNTLEVTQANTLTTPQLLELGGTVLLDSGAVLNATGHPIYGSGSLVYFGAVNGTLGVSSANTQAISIEGGSLLVNGGTIAAAGNTLIGYAGSGTPAQATVQASGLQHAVVTDNSTYLGSDLSSYGQLTLNGTVAWTDTAAATAGLGFMLVGFNALGSNVPAGLAPAPVGTAQLMVENGASLTDTNFAQIAATPDSAGNATVTNGGIWNIGTAGMGIGFAGSGTLDVLNGGTVAIAAPGFATGHYQGAQGTLLVSGQGALLTDSGGFADGKSGQGFAQAMNGGTIALTGTSGIVVGQSAGSSGTLIVGDTAFAASALLSLGPTAGGIAVGYRGVGVLDVLSGGTIDMGGTIGLGVGWTPGGSVLVSGQGALVNMGSLSHGISVGELSGVAGLMTIQNGGTVTLAGTTAIGIGYGAGSDGTMTVGNAAFGSNALLTLGTDTTGIAVGLAGSGTLDVLANGAVTINGTGGIGVGDGSAGGIILVSGSGALLNDVNPSSGSGLYIGVNSAGTMDVSSGGTVRIAASSGIEVGGTAQGTLAVQSAGSVETASLSLGGPSSGPLGNGPNVVTVTTGGQLQDTGSLAIWQGGTVAVDIFAGSGIDIGRSGAYVTGAINIDSGYALSGDGLVAAAVVNAGAIDALKPAGNPLGGTLEIQGGLSGSGTANIGSGATLRLDSTIAATETIAFASLASGALILGTPGSGLANSVAGLSAGDRIDFGNGMTVTSAAVVNANTISIGYHNASGGPAIYNLTNVALPAPGTPNLTFGLDAATGLSGIQVQSLCFLPGTLIRTPSGERPVEKLAAGDLVVTVSGRVRPTMWAGTGRVLATRGRRGAATPVIVRKGALGPNVPSADLRVTKGHSFWLDDVLIPVEFLVNHRSILWDDRAQEVTVHHIELETHDILVANGAPAESYRDDGNRWLFQNANAGWALPPKPPCAPVLTGGPVVDAVWRRLLDRAGSRPALPLTNDPDVHLTVNGVRVDAAFRTGDVLVFGLTEPGGDVRIVSRAAVPQELGLARDPRPLGVAIRRIAVRRGTRFRTIDADDPRLAVGFHAHETDIRWTDGDAALPAALFAGFAGPCELVLHLAGRTAYIDDGAVTAVA